MGHKSNISLSSFFIFNSNFGPKESQEEKKILFYYPYNSSANVRFNNVGLCEAIIKFTNKFADTPNSCQALRTQKTIQLFHQPEPDFWMIMCIAVPSETRPLPSPSDNAPTTAETRTEYRGSSVHERIFRHLLRHTYRMFRTFNGTFDGHLDAASSDCDRYARMPVRLIEALNDFYTRYLPTLRLDTCDLLDVFASLRYMPVERLLFLQIHTFVQLVQARFSRVKHCILLHDEQLVWSELNPTDMYSVYEYLTQLVFPHTIKSIACSDAASAAQHYGTFVTAPAQFQNSVPIPQVHLFEGDTETVCDLIVYRSGETAIGMMFEQHPADPLSDDAFHQLHTFLGPHLATIGAAIYEAPAAAAERSEKHTAGDPASSDPNDMYAPRYLFFNELDQRHIGTMHRNVACSGSAGSVWRKRTCVPEDVVNLLADMYDDERAAADRSNDMDTTVRGAEETVLKTHNDFWIVRRSANWRHFFVVVNKRSSLLSISDEAKPIFDELARNVHFN